MNFRWIYPALGVTQVLSVDPNQWGMYVLHPSVQATGVLVKPLTHGYADALRTSQNPLPTPGTWGVVAWPAGDSRNGVWLGAINVQGNDALLQGDPDADYQAHGSGAWSLLDGAGNYTFSLPDGSYVAFGNSGVKPELTRNVVNTQQVRESQAYPDSTRHASTISPLPVSLNLASGTVLSVDTSGNVTINLAASAKLNIEQGGSPSDFLTLVSKMVSVFNAHTHSDPQGGVTGTPSVPITANDIKSTLIDIQE